MPFHIEWYMPYRVISVIASGNIIGSEMNAYSDTMVQMLNEAQEHLPNYKVYNLFDATLVEKYPPVYLMFSRALPVIRMKNRGMFYHITQSRANRSILELSAHVFSFALLTFDNREAAIHTLEAELAKEEITNTSIR